MEDSILRFNIGKTVVKILGFSKKELKDELYSSVHAKNCFELHYVISGRGTYRADNEQGRLQRGTVYLETPDVLCRRHNDLSNPLCEYILIFSPEQGGEGGELTKLLSSKSFLVREDTGEYEMCFRSAEREITERRSFFPECLENNFKQLIIMLLRSCGKFPVCRSLPKAMREDKYCIITDAEFIFHHKNLTLNRLSGLLGLSQRQCQRFISENYGISYSEKLLQARMIKAADYLVFSNMDIRQVGEAVGYSGNSYFTKVFRRYYGMTPSEYRKRNDKY